MLRYILILLLKIRWGIINDGQFKLGVPRNSGHGLNSHKATKLVRMNENEMMVWDFWQYP